MASALFDLQWALRRMWTRRQHTIQVVSTWAIAIGVSGAVFTVLNAVVLRAVPFPDSERVVAVVTESRRGIQIGASLPDILEWQHSAKTLDPMAWAFGANMALSGDGRVPEQRPGAYMTASGFAIAGVRAAEGRVFSEYDDRPGATPVAVISDDVWNARYGRSSSIVGTSVRINSLDATIVGVMPAGVKVPFNSEIWLPAGQLPPAVRSQGRGARAYFVFARLSGAANVVQAQSEFRSISEELATRYPATNKDIVAVVLPFGQVASSHRTRMMLWIIAAAAGFLLLIACANVANLTLATSVERVAEIGIRTALGATRTAIVRQLLIESALVAMTGGVAGIALSLVAVRWFDNVTGDVTRPYWIVYTVDPETVAVCVTLSLLTGIASGLMPALHVSQSNVTAALNTAGRGLLGSVRAKRWGVAFGIAQVTLTLSLLFGAALIGRSFLKLYRMESGMRSSGVVTMQITMPARKYISVEDRITFLDRLEQRLEHLPPIVESATTSNLPSGGGVLRHVQRDDSSPSSGGRDELATLVTVGGHYFDTLGVRLLSGRYFVNRGETDQSSVIINSRFAETYFNGINPIGRRVRLTEEISTGPQMGWLTVIGVAQSIRQINTNGETPDAVAYVPHRVLPTFGRVVNILVRANANVADTASTIVAGMRLLDPDMPIYNVRTLDEQLSQNREPYRIYGTVATTFALVALILSAMGLYAQTSCSLAQRTREIGLRIALGARPLAIYGAVANTAIRQIIIGTVLGSLSCIGVSRTLRSVLVGSDALDHSIVIPVIVVVILVTAIACVNPIRSALRRGAAFALRYE